MKKPLLILMTIVGALVANAVEIHCTGCNAKVLPGDKFCPNCGARFEEPSNVKPEPSQTASGLLHQSEIGSTDAVSYQNASAVDHGANKPFSLVERAAGMGRGLLTAVFSPMCLLRGMDYGGNLVTGGKDVDNLFTAMAAELMVFPCAALGSVSMCADVIDGVVDLISFGYYGDWLYSPDAIHAPTPWFWERKWDYSDGRFDFPWITK